MKRKIALMLILTLTVAGTVACTNNKNTTPAESTTEVTEEKPAEEKIATAPEYATTSVAYDGDSKYFTGSIQCVQITDSEHKALAEAVEKEFSKRIKVFNKEADSYVAEADDVNKDVEDDMVAYYTDNTYAIVVRADSQIFSIKLVNDLYTGGAHGGHVIEGLVFDSQTGKLLSWEDLGDVSNQAMNYILNNISESGESAQMGLYEEYETTIKEDFEDAENKVAMWLSKRGLVVGLQEYDIAPYAAGIPTFTIPYSELEGFNADYIPTEDSFYAFELSQFGFIDKVDINSDGQLDNIAVVSTYDEESGNSTYTVNLGDESIKLIDDSNNGQYDFATAYYVHRVDANYVFGVLSGSGEQLTRMFRIDGGNIREIASEEFGVNSITEDKIVLEKMVDGFGTWLGTKDFTYDNTGFSTTDKAYIIDNNPSNNSNATGITLKRDLPYYSDDSKEESAGVLEEGSVIYPIAIFEDDNMVEFVSEDGQVDGYIYYTLEDGVRYVDGIDEYNVFEELPYSG